MKAELANCARIVESLKARLELEMYEQKNDSYIKPYYEDDEETNDRARAKPNRLPLQESSPLTRFCETCDYTKAAQPPNTVIQRPKQLSALHEMRIKLDQLREQSMGFRHRGATNYYEAEHDQVNTSLSINVESIQRRRGNAQDSEHLDEELHELSMSSSEWEDGSTQLYDISNELADETAESSVAGEQAEDTAIRLLNKTSLLENTHTPTLQEDINDARTTIPGLDLLKQAPYNLPEAPFWTVSHTERCNFLLFGPPGKHRPTNPSPHRIFPPTIRKEHVKHLIKHLIHEPYIPMAPYTEYSQRVRTKTLDSQEYLPIVVVEALMMKWMSKASYKFFEREEMECKKPIRARRCDGFNMLKCRAVMRSAINIWTQNYEYEDPPSESEEQVEEDEQEGCEEDKDIYDEEDNESNQVSDTEEQVNVEAWIKAGEAITAHYRDDEDDTTLVHDPVDGGDDTLVLNSACEEYFKNRPN